MYNFRYHLVTIVSIFAALVIGLLLGIAITGSDLVRDTANNATQSLSERFDELNDTNEQLSAQLTGETNFSAELYHTWQNNRLKGRIIAVLVRDVSTGADTTTRICEQIKASGGIPILVQIDAATGFGIDDAEDISPVLKDIVEQADGVEYSQSLALELAKEWTFTTNLNDLLLEDSFYDNYRLTRYLISEKAITIDVDYQPLIDQLEAEQIWDANLGVQLDALKLAQEEKLVYGINGVVDAAIYTQNGDQNVVFDPVALYLTTSIESRGLTNQLPYALKATADLSDIGEIIGSAVTGENEQVKTPPVSSDANYYTLLVSYDANYELVGRVSRENGISAVVSSMTMMSDYNIIALLSGAGRGQYGLNDLGVEVFAPASSDVTGLTAFANSQAIVGGTKNASDESAEENSAAAGNAGEVAGDDATGAAGE